MTFADFCHQQISPFEGESQHLKQPNRLVHDTLLRAVAMAREHAARRGHLDAFELEGEGMLAFPTLLHAFRLMKGTMALQSLGNEFVLTPASAQDVGLDFTQASILQAYEHLRRGRIGAQEMRRDEDEGALKEELEALFRLDDDPVHDMAAVLEAEDPVFTDQDHPLKVGARFLFIDEGHDLNQAMFTVTRHLVDVNPIEQMFVVGDPDQVIHSDTGAARHFMTDTLGFGQPSRTHSLPLCRRFGEALATPLGVHAGKPYGYLGMNDTVVSIYKAPGNDAVSAFVAAVHRRMAPQDPGRVASIAVLLRSPGASVQLENSLALDGFHIETNGFEPYMERPEVHFLRILVAWASDAMDTLANADLPAMQAALGEFTGFAGHPKATPVRHKKIETFIPYVLGSSAASFLADAEAHLRPPPLLYFSDGAAVHAIRRFLDKFLAGVAPSSLPALVEDAGFKALAKRAFVFEERVDEASQAMREFARSAERFSDFRAWLQQMANREYAAARQGRGTLPLLRLYTIPAAKGLEFDHVIMPDVNGHAFDGDSQEERNLFYVAASRARKELTMMYQSVPSSYLQPFEDSAHWDELHE
jgi:DNA helicase-2/ATP-dependent DNA helicase PcrA